MKYWNIELHKNKLKCDCWNKEDQLRQNIIQYNEMRKNDIDEV
jgi:hypothetical protein